MEKPYFVHQSSFVDEPCEIGAGSKIWHFSHVMANCTLGERCNIGQNVVISPGVTIGNNVKIQNNVSVYTGCILEDDVFCGPSMVFTNVVNPRSHVTRRDEYRRTLVKKGASLGANSTVVCGVEIGRYAFVGAGSVVTKSVPDYALVFGNPARIRGWMCACGVKLEFSSDTTNSNREYAPDWGTSAWSGTLFVTTDTKSGIAPPAEIASQCTPIICAGYIREALIVFSDAACPYTLTLFWIFALLPMVASARWYRSPAIRNSRRVPDLQPDFTVIDKARLMDKVRFHEVYIRAMGCALANPRTGIVADAAGCCLRTLMTGRTRSLRLSKCWHQPQLIPCVSKATARLLASIIARYALCQTRSNTINPVECLRTQPSVYCR